MLLFNKNLTDFNAQQVIIDLAKRHDIQWRMALQVLLTLYMLENETHNSNKHEFDAIQEKLHGVSGRN